MKSEQHDIDPIETALSELDAAERAGVFRRTPVELRDLQHAHVTASDARPQWLTLRLWPVAAAIVLAIGVSSWMFAGELAELRRQSRMASTTHPVETGGAYVAFNTCFNGPTNDRDNAGCVGQDFDADGDVDLADFRNYQLAYAGQSR